jgi:hypothetical protein
MFSNTYHNTTVRLTTQTSSREKTRESKRNGRTTIAPSGEVPPSFYVSESSRTEQHYQKEMQR